MCNTGRGVLCQTGSGRAGAAGAPLCIGRAVATGAHVHELLDDSEADGTEAKDGCGRALVHLGRVRDGAPARGDAAPQQADLKPGISCSVASAFTDNCDQAAERKHRFRCPRDRRGNRWWKTNAASLAGWEKGKKAHIRRREATRAQTLLRQLNAVAVSAPALSAPSRASIEISRRYHPTLSSSQLRHPLEKRFCQNALSSM